jgi:hypothetical protein
MEEANAWRNPVDLVTLLEDAFVRLPEALAAGASRRGGWWGRDAVVAAVLGDEPAGSLEALLTGFAEGATETELASAVSFAAATRVARFPRSTSSATGTLPYIRLRSRTPSSKDCAARRPRSSSAECSTRR